MSDELSGLRNRRYYEHRVLVLNADGNPMGFPPLTLSSDEAITALFLGRVTVVIPSEDIWGHSERDIINVPHVVISTKYAPQQNLGKPAAFNENSLFIRDQAICMYGRRQVSWRNRDPKHRATVEHIHPDSQGGAWDWHNCVLVSAELNSRKADTRLDQMHRRKRKQFTPLLAPWEPSCGEMFALNQLHYADHPFWAEFLATIKPTRRVLEVREKVALAA
jgi:5-methylcytosine-specific restriction endonuclease McrA